MSRLYADTIDNWNARPSASEYYTYLPRLGHFEGYDEQPSPPVFYFEAFES
ncbi:hypothetical protein GZH53_16780 [Flavihumibacter sp. R14]|nr:hypothetical protein [Flavihumibacter soli]